MSALSCETFKALIAHFETFPIARDAPEAVTLEDWAEHLHACHACSDALLADRVRRLGVEIADYACVHMAYRATQTCDQHPDRSECSDLVIAYSPRFDEYAIIKNDVSLTIHYCPWCGIALPPSQRDRWFDEVTALIGCHPWSPEAPEIPQRYRTSAWFKPVRKAGQS
ncbi:MAG: DUF6980 family protein [Hyphomicrobium sp.]